MKFSSFARLFGKRWSGAEARPSRARARRSGARPPKAVLGLESLEDRNLMAVLPVPTVTGHFDMSSFGARTQTSNESSPQVAVDPNDPQKLFAVYTRHETNVQNPPRINIEATFSTNGGQTWQQIFLPGNLPNPATSNPVTAFPIASDASVAFDRDSNVYLLYAQRTANSDAGAIVLLKYDFSGGAPAQVLLPNFIGGGFFGGGNAKVLYEWIGNVDAAVTPTLAVDSGLPRFTDPQSLITQLNPWADNPTTTDLDGNVYVAWATINTNTAPTGLPQFNPNRIKVLGSSDGGQTFTTRSFVDDFGDIGPQRYGMPRLVVSQGTADGSVPGGQLTLVWDDFGSGTNANPRRSFIMSDRIQDGAVSFEVQTAGIQFINDGIDPGGGAPHLQSITDFPLTVNITDPRFTRLTDVDVNVGITRGNLNEYLIELIAPDGTSVPLILNQTLSNGNTVQGRGITGTDLGATASGITLGATFDDEAIRSIRDGSASPYVGHFRPEGSLSANFYDPTQPYTVGGARNVNGQWILRITDFRDNGTAPPAFLQHWTLTLASGMSTGFDTQVTSSTAIGSLTGTYSNSLGTTVSPTGIGVAPAIASDNTLGSFSPYQGRLYLAYVDRSTATANPADNSDIFLVTSDDGGLSWSFPQRVNDDLATRDGFSEGDFIPGFLGNFSQAGRAQFMPSVAVDQSTGTLVLSFYDARHDASRGRVATYLATSIDGGVTFGPQTFANTPNTVFDALTRENIDLGPIPDNQVGPNAVSANYDLGYGYRQGLAVSNGRVYPVWSGNENGGDFGGNARRHLDILVAPTTIATGPRIVSSTMGPAEAISVDGTLNLQPLPSQVNLGVPPVGTGGTGVFASDVTESNIVVAANPNSKVDDLRVTVSINHPRISDLVLSLIGPDGTEVFLAQNSPANPTTGTNFTNTTFSDLATQVLSAGRAPYTGTFRPVAPLSAFRGKAVNGTWRLRINDTQTGQSGTLVNWSLAIDTTAFNDTFAPDGTRRADAFIVEFDRPVDASSFTVNDVRVSFRTPFTPSTDPGVSLPITSVTVLNPSPIPNRALPDFDTRFLVRFDPSPALNVGGTFTGTYSYTIGPGIRDLVRTVSQVIIPGTGGTVFTAPPSQVNRRIPPVGSGGSPNAADNTTVSQLTISGFPAGQQVTDVNVTVRLTHTFDGDLILTLIAPDGTRRVLSSFNGGSGDNYTNTTFDDQASIPVQFGTAPFSGSFRPEQPLSILNGRDPNGTWTLEIQDLAGGDIGLLQAWSITINGGTPTTTLQVTAGNGMDQNANGVGSEDPADPTQPPIFGLAPGDVYAVPRPAPETATLFRGNFFPPPFDSTTLPLIVSGPRVVSTRPVYEEDLPGVGRATSTNPASPDNLVLGAVTYRSADAPLVIAPGAMVDSRLSVLDTYLVEGGTLSLNLSHANAADLEVFLVAPDGDEVLLFNRRGTPGTADLGGIDPQTNRPRESVVFDDAATLPIQLALAPFTGRFRPEQALEPLLRNADAATRRRADGVWRLRVVNNSGAVTGTLNSWSLTLRKTARVNAVDVVFDRDMQPGSFDASDIVSVNGPTGPIGQPQTYASSDVNRDFSRVYQATNVGQQIPDGGTLTSTLAIADNQTITNLRVRLNITHPNVGDLTVSLIAPDGTTRIRLVDSLAATAANFPGIIFDDSASNPISAATGPFNPGDVYIPVELLNAFNGMNLGGIWTLEVVDNITGNVGTLNGWALLTETSSLISSLTISDAFYNLSDLNVQLSIVHPRIRDLTVALEGPDGTKVQLFSRVGSATDADMTNTVFDDQAPVAIGDPGTQAPFTGTFRPQLGPVLREFNGKNIHGTWRLLISDDVTGMNGQLLAWSLTATPTPITVTPNPLGTPAALARRTFRVNLPTQGLPGTYSLVLDPDIRGENGSEQLDTNRNAGLDVLRGVNPTGSAISLTIPGPNGLAIQPGQKTVSNLIFPEDFLVQGTLVAVDITHPNVPDLEIALIAPDDTRVTLARAVGSPNGQNFRTTVFDDNAATLIQNGQAPFSGRFKPILPLSALNNHRSVSSAGIPWRLEITNNGSSAGTLTGWALTLFKATPGTGLGERVADQQPISFRIFSMNQADPLARNTWTPVGPAASNANFNSGRVGALALDPSDPSGNTVYAGGDSGGIWKTTNFLTSDPRGPIWMPLTDFGPTFSLNIGSMAVFGRNNDPAQSIIIAGTGDPDQVNAAGISVDPGIGFLISTNGGRNWTLYDSFDNSAPFPQRAHDFVGNTVFKVVVDPRPSVTNDVIIYAALSGPDGGIYRSLNTGRTWQQMRAGNATDVLLDPNSGIVDQVSNPTGNLDIVYGAFRGQGVFISPNRGVVWNQMTGGVGNPLIRDGEINPPPAVGVANTGTPNGTQGRIVLAKPARVPDSEPLASVQNILLQGWLYALVSTPGGLLEGLYVTKNFGQDWTEIHIPTEPPVQGIIRAIPSNDTTNNDYSVIGNNNFPQGNYNLTLAVDPTNPNIVYVGGTSNFQPTGFIRVDATGVYDAHAFYLSNDNPDGNELRVNTTGPVDLKNSGNNPFTFQYNPVFDPTINLIQDPLQPFVVNATIFTSNTNLFTNTGGGARWIPFDDPLITPAGFFASNEHELLVIRDPLTGRARLIFGNDNGVYTGVDNGGTYIATGIGTQPVAFGSRTGNLQIGQFFYGAAQPSGLAAQVSGALLYAMSINNGYPTSDPNILENGNLGYTALGSDGTAVATDQQGRGTVYQTVWPGSGNGTDFFLVNGVSRINQLIQQTTGGGVTGDPQWPNSPSFNFAVNPLNGDQIVISSAAGRIFATTNQGAFWLEIGNPNALDGSNAPALAYGAPDPNGPNPGAINNFIYAGTDSGNIFVTFTGGGGQGNQWTDISNGLDGNPVRAIITNPNRGSHEAYAVTTGGVFHIADSAAPGATWTNITGNLFQISHAPFGDPSLSETLPRFLESIVADWRYVLPDSATDPNGPSHPILYVGGAAGVFRSIDDGRTWTRFPHQTATVSDTTPDDGATRDGGLLPNAHVTDLDLALGNINPTTGRPDVSTGSSLLLATTFGRGSFGIRLGPIVFADTLAITPVPVAGLTRNLRPTITGLSAQTAFGNTTRIDLLDLSDPSNPNPPVIGTGTTDATGRFSIQVNAGVFRADGTTDGIKVIGVRAIDDAGVIGETITASALTFVLDTTPIIDLASIRLDPATDSGFSNSDRITNNTQPILLGQVSQVQGGVTIEVYDRGADPTLSNPIGVGLTDNNGVISRLVGGTLVPGVQVNAGRLTTNGFKDLVIKATNGARFTLAPLTNPQLFLDTQPPLAPTVAPDLTPASDSGTSTDPATAQLLRNDNITNVTLPTFTGSVREAGGRVYLYANGNLVGIGSVTALATYTVTVGTAPGNPVLANGTYTLTVRQEDVAGNVGPASPGLSVTIDTIPPGSPSVPDLLRQDDTGISDTDNITANNQPRFFVVADVGTEVQIRLRAFGTTGPFVVVGSAVPDANGNVTVPTVPLADGRYEVTAVAVDLAGNSATSTALQPELVIDTTVPGALAAPDLADTDDTGSSNSDNYTRRTTPAFRGTAEANAQVQLFIDNDPAPRGVGIANANGQYTVTVGRPLADGTYLVRVRQIDPAGNVGTLSTPTVLVVDTTVAPPTLDMAATSDTGISSIDHITRLPAPVFLGQAEPNAVVAAFANGNPAGQGQANPAGFYAFAIGALPDGVYIITVQQTDLAGNVSSLSSQLTPNLVIDTVPPQTPGAPSLDADSDLGGSNTDHVTSNTRPIIRGTAEGNSRIFVLANGAIVAQGASTPAGAYAVTISSGLTDGVYRITVQVADPAGNVSPESSPLSPALLVDTRPPQQPSLRLNPASDSGQAGDNITAITPQVLEGTVEPGSSVVVRDGATVLASFVQGANSNFSLTVNLAEGQHTLTVETIDNAGNVAVSAPLTVTIDPTALDSDRRFIRSVYLRALGRPGSVQEWDFWVPILNRASGRKVVVNAIERSDEARTVLLRGYYQKYLGRNLVQGEEQFWVSVFRAGATEEQVLSLLLASPEYVNRAPSIPGVGFGPTPDAAWVRALYLQVLGRPASEADVIFWANAIPVFGRVGVVGAILNSVEFRALTVRAYYSDVLGRPTAPTQGEVDFWVLFGQDLTSLRVGFESSDEYFQRVTGFRP